MSELRENRNIWEDALNKVDTPPLPDSWKAMEGILDNEMPPPSNNRYWSWLLLLLLLLIIGVCYFRPSAGNHSQQNTSLASHSPAPVNGSGSVGDQATNSEADTADTTNSGSTQSGSHNTETSSSASTTNAGAAGSGAISSGAANSGAVSSGAANSGAAGSGTISSGAANSGAVSSGAASSGAANSGAISSGAAQTGSLSSGASTSSPAKTAANGATPNVSVNPPSAANTTTVTSRTTSDTKHNTSKTSHSPSGTRASPSMTSRSPSGIGATAATAEAHASESGNTTSGSGGTVSQGTESPDTGAKGTSNNITPTSATTNTGALTGKANGEEAPNATGTTTSNAASGTTTTNAANIPGRSALGGTTATSANKSTTTSKNTSPAKTTNTTAAKSAKKSPPSKDAAHKHGFSVGIGLNQFFALGDQSKSNLNADGTTGTLTDYLPVPEIRYYFRPRLYVQLEAQFNTPQYTKPNLVASQHVTLDSSNTVQPYTATSVYIKKLYYFNLPLSVHYSPIKHLFLGAGIEYAKMTNGVALFQQYSSSLITTTNGNNPSLTDSIHYSKLQSFKGDSVYKMLNTQEFRVLFDASFQWKGFTLGLRYNQALERFINVQISNSQVSQSRNSSLQLYLRYTLWRQKTLKPYEW